VPARPPAVVLDANCMGLPSDTDDNPMQFGHQRPRGASGAPTAAHSLPSMMQFGHAQLPNAKRTTTRRRPESYSAFALAAAR
jgi:hypothetical protein